MELWNNYHVVYKGINYDKTYDEYILSTIIRDNKTNYDLVFIDSYYSYNMLVVGIYTNEKMIKKLKLPHYMHHADFSYMKDNKYYDQKMKKGRDIICLSLGTGNIGKIIKDVIQYWKDNGFKVNFFEFARETGATTNIKGTRIYDIRNH